MIALLIVILLISLASTGFCIYTAINIKNKTDIIIKNNDAVTEVDKEIADLRKDIIDLKNNPTEFTNRFSVVDLPFKTLFTIVHACTRVRLSYKFRYNLFPCAEPFIIPFA